MNIYLVNAVTWLIVCLGVLIIVNQDRILKLRRNQLNLYKRQIKLYRQICSLHREIILGLKNKETKVKVTILKGADVDFHKHEVGELSTDTAQRPMTEEESAIAKDLDQHFEELDNEDIPEV